MYHELRSLARVRLRSHDTSGGAHTLQPTALVHEAYLRLTRGAGGAEWNGPGHFFGAAAEAMRQVLVDHARAKGAIKRGGDRNRLELNSSMASAKDATPDDLLLVSEAADVLQQEDPLLATILKLRYFAGLGREEAALAVDLPLRTFDRRWRYIVARLRELHEPHP
jgi:RNA polymerase sigma factor (TIGR02999 family)